MGDSKDNSQEATSALAILRALAPSRRLSVGEALRLAELQAVRLLALHKVRQAPVPEEIVADQGRITVDYDFDMPAAVSGASHWNIQRHLWVITINGRQSETRQRFTLMHEYKHIIDHGHPGLLETATDRRYSLPANEFVAEYFAGCVLMPRALILRSWNEGVQVAAVLAVRFDVSERAMEVRLSQLKLTSRAPGNGRHGETREGTAA